MSREIKFRAWDCKSKQMHKIGYGNGKDIVMLLTEDNKWSFWSVNDEQDFDSSEDKNCLVNFVSDKLMQYTGLKDLNGREIYEGDVVKWGNHCGWCHEHTIRVAVVKYLPDLVFDAVNIENQFPYGQFAYSHRGDNWQLEHVEVIGNIYENPELLEAA